MVGTCSTHGRDEKVIQTFGWKPEENRKLGKPGRTSEINIIMDRREVRFKLVGFICLSLVTSDGLC